nr:hypothetical protein [Tanacetum cinerariifolium]
MFDCDEMFSSETDESLPASPIYDRYHSGDRYHAVPPPYKGTFMPPKPDLVFHDAPTVNETDHTAFNVKLSPTKHDKDFSHTYRPLTPIIEDWVSDLEDDSKVEIPQNTPSFIQTTKQVKPPRSSVKTVKISIPAVTQKTAIPKLQSHENHRNRKACFVCKCFTYLIKDWNMSYLSDFEELNGGYVAFGGNPKGAKISDTECIALSPEFKLPDENQVLLRVPRENNMYNVDLKNIVPSGDLTYLFAKATLDESNLWHRRLGHINFKTMNKLVKGKKPEFEGEKPEFEVHVSPSSKDVGVEADFTNLETTITVSPIPATRVHKDHPVTQIIGGLSLATQTRSMTRVAKDQGGLTQINNEDFQTCMFACFLSQEKPKRVHQAVKDLSWIEDMQEELLQFKMQKVWVLVDFPDEKRAIGTKWVFRNKKDERGIVVRNKARLVAQGHTQEEDIDYEEFFSPVARIEAIRLFFAYASFMGFIVYQMDVKSAFLYGTIEEEVYVCQPRRFKDPDYPDKVHKVVKALYVLHQAPKAWYETLANYLLENGFQKGKIDQTLFIKKKKVISCLQVKQKQNRIFINQDKYVAEILRKFGLTDGKSASTPIDTEKPLLKDPDGEDVDVHTYRSMIGSLMYLTLSRPDIMFVVCACAHFQVTPKVSHLHAIKRIFRYLKGKPHLGLWYPKDSPFNLVAYSDSDYAGASLDRQSITMGC